MQSPGSCRDIGKLPSRSYQSPMNRDREETDSMATSSILRVPRQRYSSEMRGIMRTEAGRELLVDDRGISSLTLKIDRHHVG